MHTVETSLCMGIMLIVIMQFILASFNIERNISNYTDKKIYNVECEYKKEKNIKKTYTPAELKKCISIIENIKGGNYGYEN